MILNWSIIQQLVVQGIRKNETQEIYCGLSPLSAAVRSNIGKDFLNLVDKSFPKGHPLRKLFNRNTVKVDYSCTQNMESIISSRNKKLLATPQPDERKCSCTKNTPCPLEGKCLTRNLIYQATVTLEVKSKKSYTGLCSTTFKERLGVHKQSFKDETKNQTSLSKYIWDLKRKNKKFENKR